MVFGTRLVCNSAYSAHGRCAPVVHRQAQRNVNHAVSEVEWSKTLSSRVLQSWGYASHGTSHRAVAPVYCTLVEAHRRVLCI